MSDRKAFWKFRLTVKGHSGKKRPTKNRSRSGKGELGSELGSHWREAGENNCLGVTVVRGGRDKGAGGSCVDRFLKCDCPPKKIVAKPALNPVREALLREPC